MDPFVLALSKLNRQRFDECIDICSLILEKNPYDQVSHLLRHRRPGCWSARHWLKKLG